MNKVTLYQKDTKNNTRVWSIWVEANVIHSEAGILGGSLIKTETEVENGTNMGRSNERTPNEQAEFDAQSEINRKIKAGYVSDPTQIKAKHETATINKPMKGEVYRNVPVEGSKSYTLAEAGYLNKMVGAQPKLDGWRFRLKVSELGCIFHTASGDITLPFPQIEDSVYSRYCELGIDEEIILDGELYNHYIPFDIIQGACNSGRGKKLQSQLQAKHKIVRDKLEFHLFDYISDSTSEVFYEERYKLIQPFASNWVIPIKTTFLVAKHSELADLFEQELENGCEGLIIRNLSIPYQHNKNKKNFLKWKPLIDSECRITGFVKSITGDTLGSLMCQFPDGTEFSSDLRGEFATDAYKQKIWNNKSYYLDKIVVVSYLNLTKDGKPRHPRVSKFRSETDLT